MSVKISRKQTWVIVVGLVLLGYFMRVLHVGDQSIGRLSIFIRQNSHRGASVELALR